MKTYKKFEELTELEKAEMMMDTITECAKKYPEMDWEEVRAKAAERLKKAIEAQEIFKPGDKVLHEGTGEVATIESVREVYRPVFGGWRKVYKLDFGKDVFFRFGINLQGGEFLPEALTLYKE